MSASVAEENISFCHVSHNNYFRFPNKIPFNNSSTLSFREGIQMNAKISNPTFGLQTSWINLAIWLTTPEPNKNVSLSESSSDWSNLRKSELLLLDSTPIFTQYYSMLGGLVRVPPNKTVFQDDAQSTVIVCSHVWHRVTLSTRAGWWCRTVTCRTASLTLRHFLVTAHKTRPSLYGQDNQSPQLFIAEFGVM